MNERPVELLTSYQREQLLAVYTTYREDYSLYGRVHYRTEQARSDLYDWLEQILEDCYVPGRVSREALYREIATAVGLQPTSVRELMRKVRSRTPA